MKKENLCPGCGCNVFANAPRKVVRERSHGREVFIVCVLCFEKLFIDEEHEGFPIIDFNAADLITGEPQISYFDDQQLFAGLHSGEIQNPVVIACSEMGLCLPRISPAADVLILQNFGTHKIPGDAQLTFLIERTRTNHVVMYGHSRCRFLSWFMEDEERPDKQDSKLYNSVDELARRAVLNDIRILAQSDTMKELAAKYDIQLHAWLYDDSTDQLHAYDPASARFVDTRTTSCKQ